MSDPDAVAGQRGSVAQSSLAACLAAGGDAVAAGRTAAALWRLDIRPGRAVEIMSTRLIRLPGVRAHRVRRLPRADRGRTQGVPVTSVARTLADLAPQLTSHALEQAVDDALRRGILSVERLRRCVTALAAGRRPLGALPDILGARLEASEVGDSALEARALRSLRRAGLPPETQYRVEVAGRRYRLDMAYPEHRVAIEADGWEWHGQRGAFDADRQRANELVAAGWRILRFTSRMPEAELVRGVQRLLGCAADRVFRK